MEIQKSFIQFFKKYGIPKLRKELQNETLRKRDIVKRITFDVMRCATHDAFFNHDNIKSENFYSMDQYFLHLSIVNSIMLTMLYHSDTFITLEEESGDFTLLFFDALRFIG